MAIYQRPKESVIEEMKSTLAEYEVWSKDHPSDMATQCIEMMKNVIEHETLKLYNKPQEEKWYDDF